ncbi:TRM11 family methyltransferase [soil metagenome]
MILGRQPALGLTELESLYGADKVSVIGNQAALVSVDPCLLAFDRLGGSTKFCKHLTTLDTTDWKQIETFLLQVSPGHVQNMPDGKMNLGLSVIGLDVPVKQIEATGLTLKKVIKKTGRNVRLIPNKTPELNAAQVIHNKLTGPTGWELVFIKNGAKTEVAQTVKVQDITSYTVRDRERPKRDARVGMLPPKLAQIIINLATGTLPEDKLANICDIPAGQKVPRPQLDQTILDPFCGTGVILQEAALMGYNTYGTDLEQRMVDYTAANLEWLQPTYHIDVSAELEKGDATNHQWERATVDFVACESYLGRPFTARPSDEILNQTASECNLIIKKFLQNIHGQLKMGTRLCIAVPAWQIRNGQFKHLSLLDSLEELGYNRVSFERTTDQDLLYYREDQVVARQLLVLIRK